MALVVKDRVRETSTTTGTGTLTLDGAVTGFQAFSAIGDGNTTYYTIVDAGTGAWEVGIGTYTSSGTTLSRDTILDSSNSGSAVNFGPNIKDVFCTYPAEKSISDGKTNVIEVSSTDPALRITQTGTGNALVVEDSANPDATPVVIDADGRLLLGRQSVFTGIGAILQLSGTAPNYFARRFIDTNEGAAINLGKARGTADTSVVVQANDGVGIMQFFGYDGINFIPLGNIFAAVDGTPGTNDMPGRLSFATTADGFASPTERMRIDSAGQVGIGTTAPGARLNVVANTTTDAVRITQTGTGNALVVEDSANPDATPFVIDASGNVGIGASPANNIKLDLSVSSGDSVIQSTAYAASNTTIIKLRRSTGTQSSPTIVNNGQTIGQIDISGYDGTAFIEAARIRCEVDGTPGTNDMPGRLVFFTTADGASTPTERMRITSAGEVGIGGTPGAGRTFDVLKNMTGGTSAFGIINRGTVQSDVTGAAYGISGSAITAAASFTLPAYQIFRAAQGTFGAGSTVTNQYGFLADGSLTGATNNYGFFSNIASGTGRWNFYANGTAQNYFNGTTLIGTLTNTNSSTLVSGGTISETVGGVQYLVASQADIGSAPNEIPLNQYLGALAYEDTETPALDVGTGITTGTGTICKANGGLMGGIYQMTILIDLTGLNSGGTAGDIIGVNGTALPCYIARLPAMTVLGGRMTCLETPAGGDTDIDLYSATEGTGVEDQAITALTETQIINAGTQSRGTVTYFSADPAANAYFYLVGQSTSNATYTAGRFLIEIFGVQ